MSAAPRWLVPACNLLTLSMLSMLRPGAASAEDDAARMARGEKLYIEKCVMCHQATGQGAPPVFPPLAHSDWLEKQGESAIKAICEGLWGPLTVNGQRYDNVMPAQVLDDAQVADVLVYVTNSWDNVPRAFRPEEVKTIREKTRFKTFAALVAATTFQPLPKAPAGWTVREVAPLPEFCTRFASNGSGTVYVLAQSGGVYYLDRASGTVVSLIKPADYLDLTRGDVVALGMAQSTDGRLWIVTNQRLDKGLEQVTNEVVIYRTSELADGHPIKPRPWFRTSYPYGIGPFNHGVSHLAFGPDGMLYVNSGSRTDAGEPGQNARFFQGGEVDITACLWRLDPAAEQPHIEVLARGIRNAYGFAWDGAGHLFTVSNGPDANAPEEMDFVEAGRHYGFPFQFADWPAREGTPYKHTPKGPPGVEFTMPVVNRGPAAGGNDTKPLSTFDPHSSPAGTIWCGDDFPEPLRGGFLITRFGNLLATPRDVGFDLLFAKLHRLSEHAWEARMTTVLAPLGRPLDVVRDGPGSALILEYTRPTNFKDGLGWLPGRIIELSPAPH
jgi:glucose/arabinose dehydrogenase/cytochrome c5